MASDQEFQSHMERVLAPFSLSAEEWNIVNNMTFTDADMVLAPVHGEQPEVPRHEETRGFAANRDNSTQQPAREFVVHEPLATSSRPREHFSQHDLDRAPRESLGFFNRAYAPPQQQGRELVVHEPLATSSGAHAPLPQHARGNIIHWVHAPCPACVSRMQQGRGLATHEPLAASIRPLISRPQSAREHIVHEEFATSSRARAPVPQITIDRVAREPLAMPSRAYAPLQQQGRGLAVHETLAASSRPVVYLPQPARERVVHGATLTSSMPFAPPPQLYAHQQRPISSGPCRDLLSSVFAQRQGSSSTHFQPTRASIEQNDLHMSSKALLPGAPPFGTASFGPMPLPTAPAPLLPAPQFYTTNSHGRVPFSTMPVTMPAAAPTLGTRTHGGVTFFDVAPMHPRLSTYYPGTVYTFAGNNMVGNAPLNPVYFHPKPTIVYPAGETVQQTLHAAIYGDGINCAVDLGDIPCEASANDLFKAIRNIGRVNLLHMTQPNTIGVRKPGFLVFQNGLGAQVFLGAASTALGIRVHGRRILARPSANRFMAHPRPWESRVLRIKGAKDIVNHGFLYEYIRMLNGANVLLSMYVPVEVADLIQGIVEMEWHFESILSEASIVKEVIENDPALKDIVEVHYAKDPCE